MSEVTNKDLYEELTKLRQELDSADRAIEHRVEELSKQVDRTYVKLVEFDPVRKLVYGLVGLTLVAVMSALLAIVLRNVK